MAKDPILVGSAPNDNTGDFIREAFIKVNANEDELYEGANITATAPLAKATVADTSVTLSIADNGIGATQLNVSGNGSSGYLLSSDADGSFTWVEPNTGDITGVTAGDGLTGGGNSGAVTLTLGVDDSTIEISSDAARVKDLGIVTAKIANDNVTHDKLEARYTTSGSITTYTGAVTVNWALATNFVMGSSLTGAIEFDFEGFKTGQVLTIHNLTGAQTITLDSNAATSETFNKLGEKDYDGGETNALMIECISDSANAVFNYSVLTYVSDTTPS